MMIWCVEDDSAIRDIEVYTLTSTGFKARGFADTASCRAALAEERPDLILLDIMLPGEDGVDFLHYLRTNPDTAELPVIMATAKGMEYDKIQSLDSGADDYLVKPFGMMEMVSRVKAVLRRCKPAAVQQVLQAGGLTVNPEEHTVFVNGARVMLTLKEFEILRLLLSRPGIVFTREQLMEQVWGEEYIGESRTVDIHIRTLRQKLGDCGGLIETVRGVGYRLEA